MTVRVLLFVPKYGIMCLLLRDKATTKPPPWNLNESISDAGQPEASHGPSQTIHTASSLRYHSHGPTKARLWALSGTRGVRTATPPTLPPLPAGSHQGQPPSLQLVGGRAHDPNDLQHRPGRPNNKESEKFLGTLTVKLRLWLQE